MRKAATGGISRQWLYSGVSIQNCHIWVNPSQNGQRLSKPTATATNTKPHGSRHTGAAVILRSLDWTDILTFPAMGCALFPRAPPCHDWTHNSIAGRSCEPTSTVPEGHD